MHKTHSKEEIEVSLIAFFYNPVYTWTRNYVPRTFFVSLMYAKNFLLFCTLKILFEQTKIRSTYEFFTLRVKFKFNLSSLDTIVKILKKNQCWCM